MKTDYLFHKKKEKSINIDYKRRPELGAKQHLMIAAQAANSGTGTQNGVGRSCEIRGAGGSAGEGASTSSFPTNLPFTTLMALKLRFINR